MTHERDMYERLTALAIGMQKAIDGKLNPAISQQRVTARRARIAAGMADEGRALQVVQDKLYALAEAWKKGCVPESLKRIQYKAEVETLLKPADKKTYGLGSTMQRPFKTYDAYLQAHADLAALGNPDAGQKSEAETIRDIERELIGSKIPGYFPTPPDVVYRIMMLADIRPGMRVLEPSAGKGNIADEVRKQQPEAQLDVIEIWASLRNILRLKGHNLVHDDCLTWQPDALYDRIVMNPPFEKFADITHVQAMYKLLKPGGTLVSVMGESAFFRKEKVSDAFRDWLHEVGQSVELPEGAFNSSERPTGVKTKLVIIEKPIEVIEVPAPKAPFRGATRVTPLRQQYLDIKAEYPDCILLFRLGDFYETFDHDAEVAARELDLVLTGRHISQKERVPMAGVPHHAVEQYIERLLAKGYHVAVCEQMGEPTGNGLMERKVTRVLVPDGKEKAPMERTPIGPEPAPAESTPLILKPINALRSKPKKSASIQVLPISSSFEGDATIWEIRGYTGHCIDRLKAAGCVWVNERGCWCWKGDELPLEVSDILTELHMLSVGHRYGIEQARALRGRIERRLTEM